MKISYRWLTEFVETDLGPREIADRLVNGGIEVAAISPVVEGLSGVVIAEIEAIERDLGPTPAGHQNRLCRVRLPDRSEISMITRADGSAEVHDIDPGACDILEMIDKDGWEVLSID